MKIKRSFLIVMMTMVVLAVKSQSVSVFFSDNGGKFINIRNAPNGKVVDKVSVDSNGMLEVMSPVNGWWVICGNSYEEPDKGEIKLKGGKKLYIHSSGIAFATRNYGGQKLVLRSTPSSKGKVVYSFKEEILLHPIDVKGDWVKVSTFDGKHTGWIETEWLCGNSVTNCC